jgi:integrase
MTFHSFRHSFKHHARQALIPADVHNALTGHETRSAADAYGGLSYPLAPLVEGIKRYRVPGFTLPEPPPAFRR